MSWVDSGGEPSLDIAGFWRRTIAFFIDALLLGIVGLAIGSLFFDAFARMGGYGRLIGFVVAIGYFGVFNSRIARGQTIGKMALSLRVVGADKRPISLGRSFARYSVLGIPYFLNGLPLTLSVAMSWVGYLLALVVFGVGLSILYLYVFNRRTRQSLHDLAVGTYVVRVDRDEPSRVLTPVWRGHMVIVGLLVAMSLAAPLVAQHFVGTNFFADLMPAYNAVSAQPHVAHASVNKSLFVTPGKRVHTVVAALVLDAPVQNDKDFALSTARLVAKNFPEYIKEDGIVINLTYGFDIGIASRWDRRNYEFKPEELM